MLIANRAPMDNANPFPFVSTFNTFHRAPTRPYTIIKLGPLRAATPHSPFGALTKASMAHIKPKSRALSTQYLRFSRSKCAPDIHSWVSNPLASSYLCALYLLLATRSLTPPGGLRATECQVLNQAPRAMHLMQILMVFPHYSRVAHTQAHRTSHPMHTNVLLCVAGRSFERSFCVCCIYLYLYIYIGWKELAMPMFNVP